MDGQPVKQYRLEKHLSFDVCQCLKAHGFDPHRIETGLTERGVPDIHWVGQNSCGWIELKISHQRWDGTVNGIHWRPGQQSWMVRYNKKRPGSCQTLVAFVDTFIMLPMKHIEKNFIQEYEQSTSLPFILLGVDR